MTDKEAQAEQKERKKTILTRQVFDYILYFGAVLSFAGIIWVSTQQQRQNNCQQDYAEANRAASVARGNAADARQAAFDNLLIQLLNTADRTQSRRLLEEYVASREEEKLQRAQNPIPDPPAEFCK